MVSSLDAAEPVATMLLPNVIHVLGVRELVYSMRYVFPADACHVMVTTLVEDRVMPDMRGVLTRTIWIVVTSLRRGDPLSVTRMLTTFVAGENPFGGAQENTPVMGLMVPPAGAPGSSEKVNVLAGMSASLAVTVKVSRVPSLTV